MKILGRKDHKDIVRIDRQRGTETLGLHYPGRQEDLLIGGIPHEVQVASLLHPTDPLFLPFNDHERDRLRG